MPVYKSYEELPKIKLRNSEELFISDSTLRDGSQMPGIVLKHKHRLKIYEYLHRIGIEKLESFVYNDRDTASIKSMFNCGYEFPEITGWARASTKDIDLVLKMDEIKETGILMSVSDPHIFEKMKLKTRQEAEDKYLTTLQYAVDHGLKTRAHLEDMTRADNIGFTYQLVEKILDINPDCMIRVCDTVGYAVPFVEMEEPYGMPSIVKHLKQNLNVKEIETHTHDDFGLAVINALAGYLHGATWSNVTFLGIGERAGNAEMEKLLLFFKHRLEGFEKYDLGCVTEFSQYMEKEIGIRIPRNKSVVGRNIFAHESGIHAAGVIKNPVTYEPYPPELVGGKRLFLIGDSSGIEVLRYKVQEVLNELMEVEITISKSDHRLRNIQADIQKLYDEEKRVSCISDEEILAYVEKYFLFEPIIEREMRHEY